jgi:hypothetical protein
MNPETLPSPTPEPSSAGWIVKLAAVLYCVFVLEMGIFLLVYPWLDDLWMRNWLLRAVPAWRPFFLSEHFRGAVSGLGILNIFIGFHEAIRLRRFARRTPVERGPDV